MSYRASVTGIDGAGKSTTISSLVNMLSPNYTVAKVGRPIYIERNQKRDYLYTNTVDLLDNAHAFMDKFSSRAGILLANNLNVAIQPSLEQKIIREHSPDLIIASRDMSICPAVYITYYFQNSKKISTELRLRIFNSFRKLGYPDQIFYLDVEPTVADKRITARIKSEQDGSRTDRAKWRHMHENPRNLSELRKYYQEAIEILKNSGINVTEISTTDLSPSEVIRKMEKSLRQQL